MRLYSTKNKSIFFSLEEAVMKGLPDDNGLFMPAAIGKIQKSILSNLELLSFQEIAYEVSKHLIGDSLEDRVIRRIVNNSINFPAPVIQLDDNTYVLELFHGPSMAFKDFGARFMAQLMGYYNESQNTKLTILVATSGDTGGAVAAGFYNTPGVDVVILYPSGKVSDIQEKQLTTLGRNITALEIEGTFDDCQALVKQAFLDKDIKERMRLSSANSINIARLIPQSFYYFEAYKQLPSKELDVVFAVPSGNFGNLTAGVFAKKMGLPVKHFLASTNTNDIIPNYLDSGVYTPRPSTRTISNAMDVGNPSNFGRLKNIYSGSGSTWNNMRHDIKGFRFTDDYTVAAIKQVDALHDYTIDPHGAIGYLAYRQYQCFFKNTQGVILETAHPAKFLDDVEEALNKKIHIPESLSDLLDKKKEATLLPATFEDFKSWLIQNKA